ncbi:hypothetical protein D2L64_04945 [Micromonospora radicis]|uniref:Uncharacterized protein n=1 Tax=Micromonospora radicis TaxID=1894971 RepID=A0A418MYD6_9ACTN|nr:hypothetical protein D2L64_04945 [Micromonospora radicis]
MVAEATDGSLLARFGEKAYYWLGTAGPVTSLVGAGLQGAFPSLETAGQYVQGAGGVMTAVSGVYSTYEKAKSAKEKEIDVETGLQQSVSQLKRGTSKPGVEIVADLVSAAGGFVTAVSALAGGRTDIAFAGTLVSGVVEAVKAFNDKRGDPYESSKNFLVEHRAEITKQENWTDLPPKVQVTLTDYYSKVDRKAAAKEVSQHKSTGRSNSVNYRPGGYGYQQNPTAGPSEPIRRNSHGGRRRGK